MASKGADVLLEDVRVLVFDYDRTLTDEELNLSEETLKPILEARVKRGVKVILASGRSLKFLLRLQDQYSFTNALVAENGGVVYLPGKREKILLGVEHAERIKKAFEGVPFPCEMREIMVGTTVDHLAAVREILERDELEARIEFNREAVLILPRSVNKGVGVVKALELLGMGKRGVVSFGDGENDASLFEIADISVAVGNAVDDLKRRADFICEDAGGRGVARFIRENILSIKLA